MAEGTVGVLAGRLPYLQDTSHEMVCVKDQLFSLPTGRMTEVRWLDEREAQAWRSLQFM
jgi:hypothetical protein